MIENTALFEPINISSDFATDAPVVLRQGDAQSFIADLPAESIGLTITSPPYNIGKSYENQQPMEDYLRSFEPLIRELRRVTASDGHVCWQVGNHVDKGEIVPLDIMFYPLFKKHGFRLRNRIIWHFNHGLHAKKRFSGRYETILWFSKSESYKFNLDPVRVPSKYPGKTNYKPGPNYGQPTGNPLGKNPSDIWEIVAQDWERELWDIPNVKANHPEKTEHPCQFPIELVQRCVLALTDEGDRVFDPFAGSGSALLAALMHERKAMGCEKDKDYVKIMKDRIQKYKDGTLKIRPLGKPVHKPSGREKVARIPEGWKHGGETK